MSKVMNILLLIFITTGCTIISSSKDELLISSEQIKASFETYGIQLSEPSGLHSENVFLRTLNNIRPETYFINENQLISMYVYSSSQEAEKGIKDIEDKTAAASVVTHRKYLVAFLCY